MSTNKKIQSESRNICNNFLAMRNGMLLSNRNNDVIQEIIDLRMQTSILPITMRKIYAYKIASIKEKLNKQKIIPLVMRKRMLYESVVNA